MILCKRKEIPSIKCDEWNLSLCVINLGAYLEKIHSFSMKILNERRTE